MSRQFFLDLAAARHRVPIGADLVLRAAPEPEAVLLDGRRLGETIAAAAAEFRTPLAFPVMDLLLEKRGLLRRFGIPEAQIDSYHFDAAPGAAERADFLRLLRDAAPTARVAANLGAITHIARHTPLLPVGMSIGPFSLATKLMADPITPVFLAGSGATADEEPEVALLEACVELSLGYILRYLELQVAAGARAVFIAEPAANQVYFSPKQMADGSPVFERYALAPNRRIAELLEARGVDLVFHCCGEIVEPMLDGFCSLRPAMLSLGSSRRLWEDARRVPGDIVLYGNLPSKRFYSDQLTEDAVAGLADDLAARMAATGHAFILGTECDTLQVEGAGDTIRRKVRRMLAA